MRRLAIFLLLSATLLAAEGPVYVLLWFDTEDYIEPSTDDAALRIANDLTQLGVRATFKVVGEKARTLEQRGRTDVIRALQQHSIGYHANTHSQQPTPAVYLRPLGYLEGAGEFQRREGPGVTDIRRIFGVTPVCYGQPGSSWGPQSNLALRRMSIPVYLDEGSQVGLDEQPFWYGGLLYVFNMGRFLVRPDLNQPARNASILARFDSDAKELSSRGGGVISSYYHPTEFVTTEFWDGVNFAKGASPPRSEWKKPERRTREESERCYRILQEYVAHAKRVPHVRFITAGDLLTLYAPQQAPHIKSAEAGAHFRQHGITFLQTAQGDLSAADLLLTLLGLTPRYVDGPTTRGETSFRGSVVPRVLFDAAKRDAVAFVNAYQRLPAVVYVGVDTLSLADFAATLAGEQAEQNLVPLRQGRLEFERYFATDPVKSFQWAIHPESFRAPELLELGRLQGWTLKPARLRVANTKVVSKK